MSQTPTPDSSVTEPESPTLAEKGKSDRGRFSSKRKLEAVLAVLRGMDAAEIARIHRVHRDTLLEWRDQFLEAGRQALAGPAKRPSDVRDREIERLREQVERLKTDVEMLQDLIVAAVNDAQRKVDETVAGKMGGMMGGLNIPGLTG